MRLRDRSKQVSKLALASVAHYTGLLDAYRRRAMRRRGVILLYHRIAEGRGSLVDYSPYGMCVRPETFGEHMGFLARYYTVVPLSELIEKVAAGAFFAKPHCAITFDDGWLDNYTNALPVLKRYGLPATVFLATNFISRQAWFWEERLKYLLAHLFQSSRELSLRPETRNQLRESLGELNIASLLTLRPSCLPRYLTGVVDEVRNRAPEERGHLMSRLEAVLALPGLQEPRRFLNWDEVGEMAAAGIDFGAHTLSHMNFERCSLDQADAEIRGSKKVVETRLGQPVLAFAYPYGKDPDQVRALVARAGYRWACTTRGNLIAEGDDLFRLNRIDIYQDVAFTLPLFACRIVRFLEAY